MPKKKYIYANKKLLLNKCFLENEDQLFYISPLLAKQIGEKFNLGKSVEERFKLYFEALHYMGISPLLDARKIRRDVADLRVDKYLSLNDRQANAITDIADEKIISIRNSFRENNFCTMFHEMNHIFSKHNYSKTSKEFQSLNDPFYVDKEIQHQFGYFLDFGENENDNYNQFDEGVTEYLALRQVAYAVKRDVPLESYRFEVQFVRMFYLLAGNALFEGYFNDGDFSRIAREIGVEDVTEKTIKSIAYAISQVQNQSMSLMLETEAILNKNMISLLANKVEGIVWDNLELFENVGEIEKLIGNAFSNFAQTFYFGSSEKDVDQLLRPEIFNFLTETYFNLVEDVNEDICEKGLEEKLGLINLENKTFDGVCDFFKFINSRNYGIVLVDEKPLTFENLLAQEKVCVYNEAKGNYIRKKQKIGDPYFMEQNGNQPDILEQIFKIDMAREKFSKPQIKEFSESEFESAQTDCEQNEAEMEM